MEAMLVEKTRSNIGEGFVKLDLLPQNRMYWQFEKNRAVASTSEISVD